MDLSRAGCTCRRENMHMSLCFTKTRMPDLCMGCRCGPFSGQDKPATGLSSLTIATTTSTVYTQHESQDHAPAAQLSRLQAAAHAPPEFLNGTFCVDGTVARRVCSSPSCIRVYVHECTYTDILIIHTDFGTPVCVCVCVRTRQTSSLRTSFDSLFPHTCD